MVFSVNVKSDVGTVSYMHDKSGFMLIFLLINDILRYLQWKRNLVWGQLVIRMNNNGFMFNIFINQ